MSQDKKTSRSATHGAPLNNNISINGDVVDSAVIVGDHNTVNQTFIHKFFNIFKSDSETLEHRSRRILLGHVENAWIKGVLDASLHGAPLLDLGIKQDPEAVTKYPWALKKESTDETLPAGTSMLEIFDSIGIGRSLLILGAPGSGKTTMLLELTRGLITRAREDVTQPIPMVFNLASWTEKLSLADWLAQELHNLYSVPRKTAPDWVKGNKLFLLLDGLDEVRQESHSKCVEAINEFRKEHGLTSLAVCSRNQDYADLSAKLAFEGAIEIQPLMQKQITEFFNRFGDDVTGIKQALEIDSGLREMAATPLFLSIMLMAYRNKRDVEILVSGDERSKHKHLFDNYIEIMFQRIQHMSHKLELTRNRILLSKKEDTKKWLSWLANRMVMQNQSFYLVEGMQPNLLTPKEKLEYSFIISCFFGFLFSLIIGFLPSLIIHWVPMMIFSSAVVITVNWKTEGLIGLCLGVIIGIIVFFLPIKTTDQLVWDGKRFVKGVFWGGLIGVLIASITSGTVIPLIKIGGLSISFEIKPVFGLLLGLGSGLILGVKIKVWNRISYVGQKLNQSAKNFLLMFLIVGLVFGVTFGGMLEIGETNLLSGFLGWTWGAIVGIVSGVIWGLLFGGITVIQHFALRFILSCNNLLPWRLVPFLDHCVDLIFLRRVGGGYIFVHRLLMEHFAEMYVETPTSKGTQK